MTVKLAGKLPDEKRNGLDTIQSRLVLSPEARHVVVLIVDSTKDEIKYLTNGDKEHTPTARILYAEPVRDDKDVSTVLDVMARTRAERLNEPTLIDFGFDLDSDAEPPAPADFSKYQRHVDVDITFPRFDEEGED